jgi:hypothetical protein
MAVALEYGTEWIAVRDGIRVDGWVRIADVPSNGPATVGVEPFQTRLTSDSTLKEALDAIVSSHTSVAAVFDGPQLLGMITAEAVSREILR